MARRRQRVIDVATELFVENGYAATSLNSIALLAGMAKRTLYQQFGDKEAIFKVVVAEKNMPTELMEFNLPANNRSASGLLTVVGKTLIDFCLADDYIALLRLMVAESRRFPQMMRDIIDASMKVLNASIAHVLQDLIDEGLIAPCDTFASAHYFFDIVVGNRPFRMTLGHDDRPPTDAELAQRIDLFLNGRLHARSDVAGDSRIAGSARKPRRMVT